MRWVFHRRSHYQKLSFIFREKINLLNLASITTLGSPLLFLKHSSSAAAYIPPPGVIEVVSNNWKDDYLTKLAEYVRVASRREDLGVFEYIIVDYAAFGGIRFIGSPKQPTITIYQLEDGEYFPPKVFRGQDRIDSRLFPNIPLTAEQIFAMSR